MEHNNNNNNTDNDIDRNISDKYSENIPLNHDNYKSSKINTFFLPIIISISISIGIIIGYIFHFQNPLSSDKLSYKDKLYNIINVIEKNYVDSVNINELYDNTISYLLENLDPHSVYIPANNFDITNQDLEGKFDGIGIEFQINRDTVSVVNVIKNGPAEKAAIMPGDKIIKVNDTIFTGTWINNTKVIKKLRGKRNSTVKLTILRPLNNSIFDVIVIRDQITTKTIDAFYNVNDTTRYIKISQFSSSTPLELKNALNNFNHSNIKKLIIDLRDNSGGFLDAAIMVADNFLQKNQLIVYTQGRNRKKQEYKASGNGLYEDKKLIILINEFTASAAEIVAGAIQDNDRGTIVGRRSFGKGLVQEQMQMPDGSAIRLTIARYYTPSGRCIQNPYSEGTEKYYENFIHRFDNNSFYDTINTQKLPKYKTIKGRTVYGGGGIMPDILVPIDTSILNINIRISDIRQIATDIFNKDKLYLKKFSNPDILIKNYTINHPVISQLNNNQKKAKYIEFLIKGFIAKLLFDDNAFYYIINQTDNIYIKAISI